jgi:hypothetical protein
LLGYLSQGITNSPAPGTIIFSKPLEFTKANCLQYNL